MEDQILLTMQNISKSFLTVKALSDVHFTLHKGEIHALMGENGAGKSTLIKVLTGVYPLDSGEIHIAGIHGPVLNASPLEAQGKGISTVYQEVNLCPNLSVAENLLIGREPKTKLGFIDWRAMNKMAQKIICDLGIDANATTTLGDCSLAIQQMIAIARATDMHCKILILDEPTSSLDDSEVSKLFELMLHLKNEGVGIIFVTHFIEQVYKVCDRITVLRNGKFVGDYAVSELPRVKLVAAMLGKDMDDLASIKPEGKDCITDEIVVDAVGLSHKGTMKPFDFKIHKGEVVGVTGLLGSGRSEMVRCLYGADRAQTGTLRMKGKQLRVKAPIDSIKAGMGYLPDDRKVDGLIGDLTVRENIILALQARQGIFNTLPEARQNELANKFIDLLHIKTASLDTPVNQLSGGNQQKVILARWLCIHPDFLILDEPTRGIDVGTKTEFQKLILQLASDGMSVVFISSEIEEMLRTCSRMCVMRDGEKVGELNGALSQSSVMSAIAGGDKR